MNEFMKLVQEYINVEEYEHKFSELLRFVPFVAPNDKEKCRTFERVL